MKIARAKLELICLIGAALLLIVILPALNATPAMVHGAPNFWHVGNFTLNLWGKYLCYAVLALAVDLLWGHTGLLSLGQALFFALGGYMLGMHLMLLAGPLGQYAAAGNNPNGLPDFMVFLGHTFLPWFWKPFASPIFAIAMVLLVPAIIALLFGYFAFRARIRGVYFSILTQALTYGAALMFFRNDLLMGGNNGFTDFRNLFGYDLRSAPTQRGLFICSAILLCAVFLFNRWLATTKFGLVQRAIRDGETRVLFSGYAASNYKLFAFVLSAIIASMAGALYVPQVGIINPSEMTPERSLEAVVWVAVGGRGTLVGPVIGAISVNALRSWATRECPDLWLIILGGLFIIVVLLLPRGIAGLPAQIRACLAMASARSHARPRPPSNDAAAAPIVHTP